jgi:hypothetical protein
LWLARRVLWTRNFSPEVLNRVTSYEVFGSDGSLPIGQALSGPVAGVVGAERVLATSVAVSALGCITLLLVPAVRNLRRAPDTALPAGAPRPPDRPRMPASNPADHCAYGHPVT